MLLRKHKTSRWCCPNGALFVNCHHHLKVIMKTAKSWRLCVQLFYQMPVHIDAAVRALAMFLFLKTRKSQREISRCCKISMGIMLNINRARLAGLRSTKAGAHGLLDPDNAIGSSDKSVSCVKKTLTPLQRMLAAKCFFFMFSYSYLTMLSLLLELALIADEDASKDSLMGLLPPS